MNTEVNTDNVALTQRLSSKTTKNYYTAGLGYVTGPVVV